MQDRRKERKKERINFGEVVVGVLSGSKSGIDFYVGIGVGVCDQYLYHQFYKILKYCPSRIQGGGVMC